MAERPCGFEPHCRYFVFMADPAVALKSAENAGWGWLNRAEGSRDSFLHPVRLFHLPAHFRLSWSAPASCAAIAWDNHVAIMTTTLALYTLDEINSFVSQSGCRALSGKDRETLSQATRRLAMAVRADGYAWQQANWIFSFTTTLFQGPGNQREACRQALLIKGQELSRYLASMSMPVVSGC